MKLTKCENGHFYDGDKYPECPYCNTELLKDHSIVHAGAAEQPTPARRQPPRRARWQAGLWCWTARPEGATCALAWGAAFWGWMGTARR